MLCNYGCGELALFILPNGKQCCRSHHNKCPALRKKNSKGLRRSHKDGRPNSSNWTKESRMKMGWNRGETKETSDAVKRNTESLKKYYEHNSGSFLGKHHSKETKDKLSKIRTDYLLNRDTHSEYFTFNNGERDIKVQGSYEKRFAEFLQNKNIKWDRYSIKYGHRRYTPDFYLPEYNCYIEVKGWMSDWDRNKMYKFLSFHPDIKIRMVESIQTIEELDTGKLKIEELVLFQNKY